MKAIKKLKLVITVLMTIFLAIGLCASGSMAQTNMSQKFRGGFLGFWNTDVVKEMSQNGMKQAFVYYGTLRSPLTKQNENDLALWSGLCKKNSLEFYVVMPMWGIHEPNWIKLSKTLYSKGNDYPKNPCPMDADFFKRAIYDRCIALAELSKTVNIDGIIIDSEMYAADEIFFPDICTCDHCFEGYSTKRNIPIDIVPKKERQLWLMKTGKLEDYRQFMQNSIAQYAAKLKADVEAINPKIKIGVAMLDRQQSFYLGFAKGLDGGLNPSYALSEQTYYEGCSKYVDEILSQFKQKYNNIELVVGIYHTKFKPQDLAAHYYYSSIDAAGYWIYTFEYMSSIFPSFSNMKPVTNKEQYWEAIRIANNEIDKLSKDSTYKTNLKNPKN